MAFNYVLNVAPDVDIERIIYEVELRLHRRLLANFLTCRYVSRTLNFNAVLSYPVDRVSSEPCSTEEAAMDAACYRVEAAFVMGAFFYPAVARNLLDASIADPIIYTTIYDFLQMAFGGNQLTSEDVVNVAFGRITNSAPPRQFTTSSPTISQLEPPGPSPPISPPVVGVVVPESGNDRNRKALIAMLYTIAGLFFIVAVLLLVASSRQRRSREEASLLVHDSPPRVSCLQPAESYDKMNPSEVDDASLYIDTAMVPQRSLLVTEGDDLSLGTGIREAVEAYQRIPPRPEEPRRAPSFVPANDLDSSFLRADDFQRVSTDELNRTLDDIYRPDGI